MNVEEQRTHLCPSPKQRVILHFNGPLQMATPRLFFLSDASRFAVPCRFVKQIK